MERLRRGSPLRSIKGDNDLARATSEERKAMVDQWNRDAGL